MAGTNQAEKQSIEKANEKHPPYELKQREARENAGRNMSREAFAPPEVNKPGDNQGDKVKNPAQTIQTVLSELTVAKQDMLKVNEIISNGGGPYATGDGFNAYEKQLTSAQQHYTQARIAADSFLYICDKQGNPMMDSTGNPIPSKENISMRQQLGNIEQDMQKYAQDKTPAGQLKLQQSMEQAHMIKDLLRSPGFVRANNAFALMFHSGDLQGKDRENFAKTGVALLTTASKFDPAMMGPPPDANFMRHYDAAMDAIMHGPGGETKPIPVPGTPESDSVPPQNQPAPDSGQANKANPPKSAPDQANDKDPAAKPVPQPADNQEPQKEQQAKKQKPETAEQQPQLPQNVVAEGNQYFINYHGLHMPTWRSKNPDGSANPPFTRAITDAQGKTHDLVRTNGLPLPVTDQSGNIFGIDNEPLIRNGMRRIGSDGLPVPAKFDDTDPMMMQKELDSKTGPLTDDTRKGYRQLIESADKLDRAGMVEAINKSTAFIDGNKDASAWESSYRTLNKQLGDLFGKLKHYPLSTQQRIELNKAWPSVHNQSDLNALNIPGVSTDPKWPDIKSTWSQYLNKSEEIKAKEKELHDRQDGLEDKVKKVRAANALSRELNYFFSSSVDTRVSYLQRLLEQDSVKAYMSMTDKSSSDAKALEGSVNVAEAKRVTADLVKIDPSLTNKISKTIHDLGMDSSLSAQPPEAEATKENNDGKSHPEQTSPPKDVSIKSPEEKEKPANDKAPNETQEKTLSLSNEQASAPDILASAYFNYLNATAVNNKVLAKPMPGEAFDKLASVWEKALDASASITPQQLAAMEEQVKNEYNSQMTKILALEKTGKQSIEQLTADDLKQVSQDAVKKATAEAGLSLMKTTSDLNKAVEALKPENKQKYNDAERKFVEAGREAEKLKGDKEKYAAAMHSAYVAKVNEQKSLDPALSKAIDANDSFLKTRQGMLAQAIDEALTNIDKYKQVDYFRLQYAQALNLQGGDQNKAKAVKLVTEAMKNPAMINVLQNTADGQKLLSDLKLQTPGMVKAQEISDKVFPEKKLLQEAIETAKTNWTGADAKFKAAENALDNEIKEKGLSQDLSKALNQIQTSIDFERARLSIALDEFHNGTRTLPDLPNQTAVDKTKDEKLVRAAMDGMNKSDWTEALMGSKGAQLQAVMMRVLRSGERENLQNLLVLDEKSKEFPILRLQHAMSASEYGFKNNDEAAKAEAKEILLNLKSLDPKTFNNTIQLRGALDQAMQGRQIEVMNGKAASIAYSDNAKTIIASDTDIQKNGLAQKGVADWFVPGASLEANKLSTQAGFDLDRVPMARAFFGGGKASTDLLINELSLAQKSNPAEAQLQHDELTKKGEGQLGDLAGMATSLVTWLATSRIAQQYLPPWLRVPAAALAAVTLGGLANNAASGNDLSASRGFIRNGTETLAAYGAVKAFNMLPSNRVLSMAGYDNIYARLGLGGKGAEFIPGLRAATQAKTMMSPLEISKGLEAIEGTGFALRPTTVANSVLPWRFSIDKTLPLWKRVGVEWAGFGGEKSLSMLESGAMKLPEFRTRMLIARTLWGGAPIAGTMGAINKSAELYTDKPEEMNSLQAFYNHRAEIGNEALRYSISGAALGLMSPGAPKWLDKGLQSTQLAADAGKAREIGKNIMNATVMLLPELLQKDSDYSDARIYDYHYKLAQQKVQAEAARAAQLSSNK